MILFFNLPPFSSLLYGKNQNFSVYLAVAAKFWKLGSSIPPIVNRGAPLPCTYAKNRASGWSLSQAFPK